MVESSATQADLIKRLEEAVTALRSAKWIVRQLYGMDMPVDPEIVRIQRYIALARKENVAGLARRPASAARLAAAKRNAKKAKGVTSEKKKKSSAENLRQWRDGPLEDDHLDE